jgi:hypothetical protein
MSRARVVVCAFALLGSLLLSRSVHAQSVKDVVRSHVKDELDEPPKPEPGPEQKPQAAPKPEKKPAPAAATKKEPPRRDLPPGEQVDVGALFTGPSDPSAPKLPQRVIGDNLKIDLTIGGGYRGWVPQQYPTVDVDAGSYYVWTFDVKAKIYKFLNIRRGYYESNGLAGPRTDEAAVASTVGSYAPKAAWLLGVLGFPWLKVWEPILRYESRAFHTKAHPKQAVCVVTEDVADDLTTCTKSTDSLRMLSGFETFVAGVTYDKSKDKTAVITQRTEKLPPLSFGIGFMQYRKPYQVTVGDSTLQDYLFDGRFRGAGLYFGTEIGGGPDRLSLVLDTQLGLGEVKLLKSLSLNALAPEDWLIGYLQGNVSIGYNLPIIRSGPTLMFVPTLNGGGATFFFFKTQQEMGETEDAQAVNWDFLWSVHAALVLSL